MYSTLSASLIAVMDEMVLVEIVTRCIWLKFSTYHITSYLQTTLMNLPLQTISN